MSGYPRSTCVLFLYIPPLLFLEIILFVLPVYEAEMIEL